MVLGQLNKNVTMHGAPSEPIVQVKAHQLTSFPATWVNHLKTAYKNEIEFLDEDSPDIDKKIEELQKNTKKAFCLECPARLACLVVKDFPHMKITTGYNHEQDRIMLKSPFFAITFPPIIPDGVITFNGISISTREFITFLRDCKVIKHLDTNIVQELVGKLLK